MSAGDEAKALASPMPMMLFWMMLFRIRVPLTPGLSQMPKPPLTNALTLFSSVKPSMTTSLALTLVPCESVTIDSAPTRLRASTPLRAPRSVRVLLTDRDPAAASGYVPDATWMVSLAEDLLIAAWIVRQ